jgi:hypothetical protein
MGVLSSPQIDEGLHSMGTKKKWSLGISIQIYRWTFKGMLRVALL